MKLFILTVLVGAATAFTSPSVQLLRSPQCCSGIASRTTTTSLNAVIDIGSEDAFDKTIKTASGLVVVDYSTTWCGPCKGVSLMRNVGNGVESRVPRACVYSMDLDTNFLPFRIISSYYYFATIIILVIAPKFEELSEKYTDAVFLKVMGDASPEASKLMKREGVRSVPSFHYFLKGEKVDVINGANAEAIEAAITKIANAKSV